MVKVVCRFFCLFSLLTLSAWSSTSSHYEQRNGTTLSLYTPQHFPHIFAIPGFKREALEMHLTLYRGYVSQTNELLIKLRQISRSAHSSSLIYSALSRRFGWEYNGMRLHELYFENMGAGELPLNSELYIRIKETFGSFENWKKEFTQYGMNRGIGWVVLFINPKNGMLMNAWIDEHDTGELIGNQPLLVMDVWEHAYITQFGLNRKAYIELFLNSIDWDVAQQRLQP